MTNPPKTYYICGPMRGYAEHNFPAFDAAAELLRQAGYNVISPAELDRAIGFNPKTDNPTPEFIEGAIRRDLEAIMSVDGVYMLKGWQASIGAQAEMAVAKWRKLEVMFEPGADREDSVLDIAKQITRGERRRDYDRAKPNHERIAASWNWYIGSRKDPSAPLSAMDAVHMMILLKMARACYTPTKDTYIDIAGYARCASEIGGFEISE